MAGPKDACFQFWNSIHDTEFVQRHPDLSVESWEHTVPLGFHADAAAFSKQDSVYVFSFNSLVGRGKTHQKRFVFTVIKKSLMLDNTMDEILRLFAWSCNTLLTGTTPSLGPQGEKLSSGGKPLAGPWRAALCQVRGDWAFFKECFNFPLERRCEYVFLLSGVFHYPTFGLERFLAGRWLAGNSLDA